MRNLILLRGAPSVGKSTWIKENGLEQYTLCADKIRLLFQGPVLNNEGNLCITQKNDGKVWKFLFQLLEERMDKGELCIIDATHSRGDMFSRYRKLAEKYRYRLQCIEFKENLDTLLDRNSKREPYKQVPEDVIRNAYTRIETQPVPGYVEVISKEDFLKQDIKKDFSNYEKIVVFGDLHSSLEPLKEYFDKNPYNPNYMYIFAGDYLDRGIQHYETISFLDELSENKNVLLLIGNHEKNKLDVHGFYHKDQWKEVCKSKEFINVTLPALEEKGWKPSDSRRFFRKLGQLAYFDYFGKTFLVTHGGLSNLPTIFTSTDEMIHGVGKYEDALEVDKSFCRNTDKNTYQIHAHRNIYSDPIQNTERTFNLEGKIEFGGELRILEINKDGFNPIEIKNMVYNKNLAVKEGKQSLDSLNDEQVVKQLLLSNDLHKKLCYDSIYSFNFSRDVFFRKKWNSITTKARGLFIDVDNYKVVARGYEKFFNDGEREEEKLPNLQKTLKFPMTGYNKENGYLGILSYYKGKWFIASKSTTGGDFAGWFKDILEDKKVLTNDLKNYVVKNNVTLLFEVIDPVNDSHIIEYPDKKVVLLDVIKNQFKFEKLPYDELCKFADNNNLECKEEGQYFKTFEEFENWYNSIKDDYDTLKHEGYVFEDQEGYMFKLKSKYYWTWKKMRSLAQSMSKGHTVELSRLTTPIENEFYAFCKTKTREELTKPIIQLRKEFERK